MANSLKKKISFVLMVLVSVSVFAKTKGSAYKTTASAKEFDIYVMYNPETMKISELGEDYQNEVQVTYSFDILENGKTTGQVRYCLFTDTGTTPETVNVEYSTLVCTVLSNLNGGVMPQFSEFKDEDVKNEFDGDFGVSAFIFESPSNFAKGYEYMMVEFFCRQGEGIVMRTFLSNDLSFFGITDNGYDMDCPANRYYHYWNFLKKE